MKKVYTHDYTDYECNVVSLRTALACENITVNGVYDENSRKGIVFDDSVLNIKVLYNPELCRKLSAKLAANAVFPRVEYSDPWYAFITIERYRNRLVINL